MLKMVLFWMRFFYEKGWSNIGWIFFVYFVMIELIFLVLCLKVMIWWDVFEIVMVMVIELIFV